MLYALNSKDDLYPWYLNKKLKIKKSNITVNQKKRKNISSCFEYIFLSYFTMCCENILTLHVIQTALAARTQRLHYVIDHPRHPQHYASPWPVIRAASLGTLSTIPPQFQRNILFGSEIHFTNTQIISDSHAIGCYAQEFQSSSSISWPTFFLKGGEGVFKNIYTHLHKIT